VVRAKTGSLVVLCGSVLAAPVAAETHIGVLGGVNFATLHETPAEAGLFSTRSLFEVGAVVDVGLGGRLSLRLEPMFLVKGSDISFDLFGPTPAEPNGAFRLSYVELPVLLSVSLSTGGVRPYLLAGPTIGYLTGAKAEAFASGKTQDVLSTFNRTDLGVSFGGGFSVPLGGALVFVEGRYSLGLKNILKDTTDTQGGTLKTRGVQVAAGVTFRLGHR
jgi:hypothetical protein